jgi:hypothetical protein
MNQPRPSLIQYHRPSSIRIRKRPAQHSVTGLVWPRTTSKNLVPGTDGRGRVKPIGTPDPTLPVAPDPRLDICRARREAAAHRLHSPSPPPRARSNIHQRNGTLLNSRRRPRRRVWQRVLLPIDPPILIVPRWLAGSEERRQGAGPDEEEAGRSLTPTRPRWGLTLSRP